MDTLCRLPNLAAGRVQFGPERRSSESPGDGETKAGIPKSPFKLMERAQTAKVGKEERKLGVERMRASRFGLHVY